MEEAGESGSEGNNSSDTDSDTDAPSVEPPAYDGPTVSPDSKRRIVQTDNASTDDAMAYLLGNPILLTHSLTY